MAHILIVDDEPDLRDLLSQILATMGHSCDQAANAEEGCNRVAEREFDLIITDIKMPGMNGLEFLRKIQPQIEGLTPCMIITALGDEVSNAVEAVRVGACNFLSKPFEIPDIRQAVTRGLELRQAYRLSHNYKQYLEQRLREKEEELRQTYDGTVSAIAAMLEGKDNTTSEHCLRVRDYCTILARAVGIPETEIRDVQLGAILHDIGKYKVPDAILMKPGPLTDEEWVEMRRHPDYGASFVKEIPFLAGAVQIIQNHHERFDGDGYPRRLQGEAIPLAARVFSVVDAFDAMCEKRCYKEAQDPGVALAELQRCAGTQFDPTVVDAFERVFGEILECQRQSQVRLASREGWLHHPPGPTLEDVAEQMRTQAASPRRTRSAI
ncbi:MAG: HD domain-containing phosphohydrolase [Planctomycetota bacterium]|jgi:putative nucleotidyltransferase with HDIG domain